jgi:hypothetical protein
MNRFDVSVYAIRCRGGRRRPFEVRWQAAGRARSKSFITRTLADSYRAELVRAARKGLEFDPHTGEAMLWAEPEPTLPGGSQPRPCTPAARSPRYDRRRPFPQLRTC